ncbi:MAG TPA: hypothetical protein PL152_01410 [Steroidobacteraceae bacterium]|nr:hypothetical protein [Steroidobacteraceae bacterium]HQR47959.1 hypothetical protein [Steroidobacteraceae bacterium]
MSDDAARLACYDAIFRASGQAVVPGAAPAATPGSVQQASTATATATAAAASAQPPAAAAPPRNPEQDFGLTPARKESLEAAKAKESATPPPPKEPAAPESMTARVTTAAHRLTGELVLILDNGQVWVQIDTETKARVKEGDEVTIRKATLGSYFLVAPNHVLVRVRRVK